MAEDGMNGVGRDLRCLRLWRGMSQQQLGEKLGLVGHYAITTISRMERGEVTPSVERSRELALALRVSVLDCVGVGIAHAWSLFRS